MGKRTRNVDKMSKKRSQGTRKESKSTRKKVLCVNLNNNVKKKKNKRINYAPADIENALKAMKDTGLSLRKAAAAYGVPVATLGRKKHLDPVGTRKKTGPETVLSIKEEDDIVKWVLARAEMGAPVTKTELLDCVQKYVKTMKIKTPFTDDRPSRHWYEGFRKRHTQLSVRKPQHLSTSRAAVTRDELKDWFTDTEKYLKEKNLFDISPTRIFNCDESSILLCPDAERVLTEKGSRAVYKIVDGGKESLTVLFMYRADGTRVPPMLMYSFKTEVPKKIVKNTPTGWGLGISDNGWMTAETFYEYIANVFYPWLIRENTEFPVVVYMDNHSSHLTLPLITFCREKTIELIMLVPNSTHVLQPLDISFFHPFKEVWKKSVPKWKSQQNVTRVKKEDFPLVLKFALDNMNDEKNVVISGFRGSGLYPFDPKAVDYDILKKSNKSKRNFDQHNGKNSNIDDILEKKQEFLQNFEKGLSADLVAKFKEASVSGSWTGDVEKKALFDYWLRIYREATDNNQQPSSNEVGFDHQSSMESVSIDMREIPTDIHSQPVDSVNYEERSQSAIAEPADSRNNVELLQSVIIDPTDSRINEELLQSEIIEPVDSHNNEELLQSFIIESVDSGNNGELLQSVIIEPVDSRTNEPLLQPVIIESVDLKDNETLFQSVIANITSGELVADLIDKEQINDLLNSNLESKSGQQRISEAADQGSEILKPPLQEIFTLPVQFLPKKKRIKIEKTGKSKLPSAGTSDAWYNLQLQKENMKRIKEEKLKNKKKLQEEKKKLMAQVKEIQQRIKNEK